MRAVLQRVSSARVTVAGAETGAVGKGLLVLLGVAAGDGPEDLEFIARKTLALRIFPDEQGKMNRSVQDIGGGILLVSQFTLLADTASGNRPAFTPAAPPAEAEKIYLQALARFAASGLKVASGRFGADMAVELVNDGPVTIILDSRQRA